MALSDKRLNYFMEFAVYFDSKNIFDFILKAVVLFAYLPFNIVFLIKEIFNK